jgi:predicted AAA+ superfamily ATPase
LLTGRYVVINLHPFSFYEYTLAFPEEKNNDRLFRQYMNTSCFPEVVNLSKTAPEIVNDYLQSIYNYGCCKRYCPTTQTSQFC